MNLSNTVTDLEVLRKLSDDELVAALKAAIHEERSLAIKVVAHLVEVDRRRLYGKLGYPHLFDYCTRGLGLTKDVAYKRSQAAFAIRKFPLVYRMLKGERIELTAVVILHRHLTLENHRELLEKASGMPTHALEFFAAGLAPRPDKADCIRSLPAISPAPLDAPRSSPPNQPEASSAPAQTAQPAAPFLLSANRTAPPAKIEPLSAERVRIAFTADRGILDMIDRAKGLLRHRYPAGNLERIIRDAFAALLDRIDPDRRLAIKRRRRAVRLQRLSRRVPQAVRDAVRKRDGGQCTFIGPQGVRCSERDRLEYDHIKPFARGGPSNDPANIRLLCRTHNNLAAERIFGEKKIRDRRRKK